MKRASTLQQRVRRQQLQRRTGQAHEAKPARPAARLDGLRTGLAEELHAFRTATLLIPQGDPPPSTTRLERKP